jgi:hypothetical protein
MICTHCGNDFTGRSNRLYCSALCKKRSENQRERFKRLVSQYPRLIRESQQAGTAGDWHTARLRKAQAERALQQIDTMGNLSGTDWLMPYVLRLQALLNRP